MLFYILFDRGLLLALHEEMGFVFQSGITTFSLFPIKKNPTAVHIKTDDGHSGSGIAFQRRGLYNLPCGPIKCTGKVGFSLELDWNNFIKPYPLYSSLYIWGEGTYVQSIWSLRLLICKRNVMYQTKRWTLTLPSTSFGKNLGKPMESFMTLVNEK